MEEAVINQPDPLLSFLPLLIMTIPLIFICRQLAKEKNKNVGLWTVLGIIPAINYFSVLYLIGASNIQLENKIDRLLEKLEAGSPAD
jgi:hypothetical protein